MRLPIGILFYLLFTPFLLKAQYGSFGLTDARQLALGNTYASNSRELYAAGKNPSLLAYSVNDRKLDVMFPNLSARAYNIDKVSTFLNDFFSQKPLDLITSIDGTGIKAALDNNGKLYIGLQIGFLAAGYSPGEKIGSFAFAMKDYLRGFIQLPQSIVEYHKGQDEFKGLYLKDFNFSSSWIRAYELSYGKMFRTNPGSGIMAIYAGIGLKYMAGFIYENIEFSAGAGYADEQGVLIGSYKANSQSALSDDINVDNAFQGEDVIQHVPFMDPVGNGFALDAGITLLLVPGVKVGVSVTDAGVINWRGKTKQTFVSGSIRLDSTLTIEDIDSLAKLIVIEKQTVEEFRTHPPGAIHVGFSFMVERFFRNFPGEMNLAVEIHQGIDKSLDNPDQPRLALGLDWKPGKKWPVFLTGISNGLQGNFSWSVGIGYELKFLEIYLASPNIIPKFEGSDVKTLSLSMCWHFVKAHRKGREGPSSGK